MLQNRSLRAPTHTTTAVASQADHLYSEGHVMFSQSEVLYKLALFVGAAMQSRRIPAVTFALAYTLFGIYFCLFYCVLIYNACHQI